MNHGKQFMISLSVLIGYFIMFVINFIANGIMVSAMTLDDTLDPFQGVIYLFSNITYLTTTICYMLVILAIYVRLKVVNDYIKEYISKDQTTVEEDCKAITIVTILHSKITETTNLINICFSFNTVTYLFQLVFFTIFFSFGFYHYIISQNSELTQLLLNVVTLQWILFYLIGIMWVIVLSCRIKSQGNLTAVLFHKMLIKKNNPKILKIVQLSALQFHHHSPEISCGMFKMDWSLMLTMIGAVFSYIIILIQFDSTQNKIQVD